MLYPGGPDPKDPYYMDLPTKRQVLGHLCDLLYLSQGTSSHMQYHIPKGRHQNSSVAHGYFLQRMTNVGWQDFDTQLHPYHMLG